MVSKKKKKVKVSENVEAINNIDVLQRKLLTVMMTMIANVMMMIVKMLMLLLLMQ